MPTGRVVAAAIVGAAVVAYALASYGLMTHAPEHPWAVAAMFGPLLLALAAAGWHRRHLPTLAACAGGVVLLAAIVARGGVGDIHRLYVLQHAGIHLALGWGFAVTLRRGATPLITLLAERVHERLTPAMRAYTRSLTAAWAAYFAAMVALSLAIYALAPWAGWSLFCTVVTPAAAVAFFVGEHLWRYRRHPEFERASLGAAWQAYRRRAEAESAR
jgi:uncharacterized membrane protein